MFEVAIYLEASSVSPRETKRKYGYVLETKTKTNKTRTVEDFEEITATYHKTLLVAAVKALKRLNRTCMVTIHINNSFVANMIENQLSKWAENGFNTISGDDIANKEEWIELSEELKKHIYTITQDKHSYTAWLRREMEKWKAE